VELLDGGAALEVPRKALGPMSDEEQCVWEDRVRKGRDAAVHEKERGVDRTSSGRERREESGVDRDRVRETSERHLKRGRDDPHTKDRARIEHASSRQTERVSGSGNGMGRSREREEDSWLLASIRVTVRGQGQREHEGQVLDLPRMGTATVRLSSGQVLAAVEACKLRPVRPSKAGQSCVVLRGTHREEAARLVEFLRDGLCLVETIDDLHMLTLPVDHLAAT
jgi:hypothetical protein